MQGGVQSPYNSFYLVAKKKISSVTLNKETLTLEFGAKETLTAELMNVKETTWISSDDTVVTVAEDGTVTAVGLGTAVITCADKTDENIKATCEVTVEDITVLAAAVSVISETGVKVTWNEVPSAESYQIYRLEVGNGSYEVAATAEAGETEWTDTSLSAGKKYRYYVEVYATVNGEKKAIKKICNQNLHHSEDYTVQNSDESSVRQDRNIKSNKGWRNSSDLDVFRSEDCEGICKRHHHSNRTWYRYNYLRIKDKRGGNGNLRSNCKRHHTASDESNGRQDKQSAFLE